MKTVNGWTLLAHPLFLQQIETLTAEVKRLQQRDPAGYQGTTSAKLLARIKHLMLVEIPGDPAKPEYRQGATLGPERKHWFRVKFGAGRFRLFFRYSTRGRIIVYAWVNDSETLRTYGAKNDAYAVFARMLDKGNPPEDGVALVAASLPPT